MKTRICGWDTEDNRYIEAGITYTTEEGGWEEVPGGYDYHRHYVPGQIYVEDVKVLFVEFYSPNGDFVTKLFRENMAEELKRAIDNEAKAQVEDWIDEGDIICEDLWESR